MSQNTDYSTRPFNSGIELREFINPITGRPYSVTRTASIADVPNYYREAYVQGQWDLFNLPSDMALQAYLDQKADGGFWGAGRRMFADTFSDMLSKWLSFSTYTLDSSRAQFEDDLAGYMPEYGAKRRTVYTNPIYAESSKRFYQSDYLAMQFGNLGTSVAMMAGMLLEQGALALLTAPFGGAGAVANTGSVAIRAARLLSSANKVRAISSTALAAYSGFREAYINGLEAGQEVYNEVLRQTGNKELAIQQGQNAVAQQVSKEGLTTATLNTLQWGLLGLTPKINANLSLAEGAKGMVGKIGKQVGRKSVELPKWGVSSIVEDGVDFFVGKIGNKYARGAIRFTGNVLSEGFEEGYQGYISNKVTRSVLKNADLEYEHIDLIDAQLWDEVVGGMIGGALFAGVGAASRGLHKTILKDDYNKLEEIKKHRKEIFKQAENEIRKWTAENLKISAALTQERIDLVTEQTELIDKQDKDSILRKQQIDRELEDNKRRSDKAKDISTMNVALISLIGDVVQDSPSMALTTSSLAKLEETKSALQAYIQEYNKWEASTGIFPFAESELSKEGNETKKEIVRILKEQGLLNDSNNLEDSRYLTDGVQIYDNQIKVFESTLKDFSEYYDKYSTDLTLTGEYVKNSYLLKEAQNHLAKLNTMVDPVTKKTVGAYEMIYDQITDENREHENAIKLFDVLLENVATELFDKYDSKYTYANAYIDLATYDAALNDASFKELIGEDEFKRLEYKFNKDKKFADFANNEREGNYYNKNTAYIKKVISDKINAEKSIEENKEKIKKLQDEKFLYDELQKQIEEQTKEVEELQKDVNQAKDSKYIEKVLIERQFNEKTVLENADKYNTKQLRRYIDELTNIAKTQEHKDLIKKIETILEEKEKQKTQKSKPKKGGDKKSENKKGEDEKGEDDHLENMASKTVNARKAAETVTTGGVESEMDAKEIIQNVNSVERAFEEGHLTNETSKEEIEETIRHLLNLFKEKSGKGDSTLPLHSLGLTINKLYNLLYVSGKADIVKIVLSNDTLMQVLDNLVFQHFKDISQERKNNVIHKIVTNNGKGFTFKVESEDSNGKKTTKEVNSNIFTKAVFYGAGDAFHAEFNAIIDEVVKELNKEFKKETKSESETILTIANNLKIPSTDLAKINMDEVGDPYNENREGEVKWIIEGLEDFEWAVFNSEKEAQNARKELSRYIRSLDKEITPAIDIENTIKNNVRNFLEGASSPTSYTSAMFTSKFFGQKLTIEDGVPKMEVDTMKYMENLYLVTVGRIIEKSTKKGKTEYVVGFSDFIDTVISLNFPFSLIEESMEWYAAGWNQLNDNKLDLKELTEYGLRHLHKRRQTQIEKSKETEETDKSKTKTVISVETKDISGDTAVSINEAGSMNIIPMTTRVSFSFNSRSGKEELSTKEGEVIDIKKGKNSTLLQESLAIEERYYVLDAKFWVDELEKAQKENKQVVLNAELADRKLWDGWKPFYYTRKEVDGKIKTTSQTANSWEEFYYIEFGKIEGAKYTVERVNELLDLFFSKDFDPLQLSEVDKKAYAIFLATTPILLTYDYNGERKAVAYMIGSHLLDGKYQGDVLKAMKEKILNQRYQAIHNGGKVVITKYLQHKYVTVVNEGISGNEAIAVISERNKEAGLKETVDIVRGIDRHKNDEIVLQRVDQNASHQLRIEDGYSFVDGKKVKNIRYLPLSWKKNPITGQRDGSVTSMSWVYNYIKYATLFYSIAELKSIQKNTKFTEDNYTNLYTKLTELLSIVPNLSNFGIDNKVAGFVVNEENIDTIIEGAKKALRKLGINNYDSKIKYFIYKDELGNFKNSVIPTMGVQNPSEVIRKVASLWHNLSEDGVFSEMDGNKCKIKLTIETELIKNTTKIQEPNLAFNSLLVDDNNTLVEETMVDTKGNKKVVTKHYVNDYILEHEITDKINNIEGVSGNTAKIFSIQPTVEYEVYDADGKIVDHKYNKTEVTKAEEIADEIKNYKQDESLEEIQNEVVRSFDFDDVDTNTEVIIVRGMDPMQLLNVLERTQNENFKDIKDLYDDGAFDDPIDPMFWFLKSDKPSITKQKKIDIVGKLDVPVFDEKITNFNDTIYTLNGVSTKDQIDLANSLIPIIFEKYVNETKNFKAFNITLLNELIRNTTKSVLENKLKFLQQSNPRSLSREGRQLLKLNALFNNNSIEDVENVIKRVLKYQYSVSQIKLEAKDVENIKSNSFSWDELTYEKTGFNKLSGLVKMALSVIRVGEDHPKKSQLNAFGLSNYEDPLYVYLNLQTVMYSTSNNIADIINTLENTELESSRKSNVYKELTAIFKNSLDDKNTINLNFPGPILNQLITKLHLHKNEMKVVDVVRGNKKNKNRTKSVLRSANLQSSRTRRVIETNSKFFTGHTTPKIVNNVRVNLWNVERLKTTKDNIQAIMDRYEKDNSLESVSYEDLNQLLISMGIFLSKSTIKGKRGDFILNKLFSKVNKDYSLGFLYIQFIDSILNDNSNVVTQGDNIIEGYKKIDSNHSLVLQNASGTYNSIISVEIENEDFELAPAYIDGKNISPLVQNMQIFDVFRDLKTSMKEGKGVNTWSDYINAVNTSNNYFIKMLNDMDEEQRMEVLKQIDVTFLGPSIIRDAIDKVNSGDIGSVTEQEYILALCAYMQQPTSVRPTILNNEEYYFREGYGWIPTPSDKGKIVGISLPLLDLRSYRKGEKKTALDVKDVYININADGKVVLSLDDRILDLLVDQFFVSELKRMIAIGQNSSYVNSKAMKEHNYFFTTFKQFNNYFVEDGDVQVPLTEWLKQKIDDPSQQLNEETLIEMIMDNFWDTVREDIEKHLQGELDKFIEVRVDVEQNDDPKKTKNVKEYHVKGKLFDSNIVTVDESNNKVFNNNLMDNKFLWDRMGVTKSNYSRDLKVHNMDGSSTNVSLNLQTTMIAMFDTIINNRLALKVITDLTTNPTELIKSSPKWNYKVDREFAIQEWTNSVNETSSALDSLITRRFAKLIAPGYKEANSDIYYQNGQQQHAVVEVNDRSISNTSFQLIQAINMPSTIANIAVKMNILYPEVKSEVYQKEIELYAAKQGQLEKLRKEGSDDADVLNELLDIIKGLQTKYPKIAQFLSVDSTDGQAYCTYTEYLKHLYGIGEISLDDFKFYDNIFGKLNRKEISFADLTEEERYKLHTLYANSVKTVYTGGLYEYTPQTEEQIDNNEPQTPLYKRDIYLKMSVFPLLPGFTEGKQIDNLRIHMENIEKNNSKNGVVEPVILVFQNSSMKFGSNENPVPLSTLYKDNLSDDEQAQLNKVITSLPRSNYKQQQSTTSDAEVSLSRNKQQTFPKATQPTALALENGISKIEDFIFPVTGQLENLIREYNKRIPNDKIEVNKNRINGKSIVKLNNFLHNRIITHQYNELISELIKEKDGTVSVEGMYKIIEKEVVSRGMNVEILNQLKLREFESEDGVKSIDFSLDLWVSDIAEAVSHLLFSIPRNKVRKIEMPGNSHYLVSSSGMLTGTSDNAIKNADKNSIVYFDKTYDSSKELGMRYIGEQNGVPVYEYEMLIPHHFMLRGDDGQSYFIDLYEKDEDGNYVWIEEKLDANDKRIGFYLKENKFSQELLKSLSFRIPTSNANMIVKGKAVGFLPDMYRDVVIFGKDHIAQLGEDFDIDVRYIYKYFYAFRNAKFERVKFNINNQQSLKNSLLDVYFSIYETGNPELQQEFHKALSTEVEEFTAREFKKMFHEEDDNTTFYDLSYNMENMQGADIASDAIGIHALDRKMLSVMDKSGLSDLEFTTTTTVFEEESDGTVHVVSKDIPFRFVLGEVDNTKMKGDNKVKLGRHKTIDGQRSIFDSSNNRLQAAVDNQAKGILSAVNEDTTTVSVIRFLDAIGFNSHWNDGKNTWDLAYMFISQPILRDYSRLMKNIKSIFSDEFKYNKLMDLIEQYGVKTNRENKVDYVRRDQLLWALAEHLGFTKVIKDKEGEEITVLDVDEKSDLCYYDPNNIFKLDKFYKLSAKLTPNKLLNELKNNKTPDQELQLIVLMKFLELEEQALKYNDLASLLNKSDKIKDMFDVIDVKKTMAGLIEGNGIDNSFGLIGEYIDDVENKLASGEITHKDLYGFYEMELNGIKYYIKPTTTEGMELIHVLRAIDRFIAPYYPYDNLNIESVIKTIQNNAKSVYTKNDNKVRELHEDIIKSLRKYLEKSPKNGLIDSDTTYRSALSILFKDSEENESLGTYVQALRSRGVRSISGFIDKLTVRIDDTTTLVDGNFLNLDVNELSDIQFIFKNMLNNTNPIVDNYGISILWNGKEVTYRELAQTFIVYNKLRSTNSSLLGFNNVFPSEYYDFVGFSDQLNENVDNFLYGDNSSEHVKIFTRQYAQSNIELFPETILEKDKTYFTDFTHIFKGEYSLEQFREVITNLERALTGDSNLKVRDVDIMQYMSSFTTTEFSKEFLKFRTSKNDYILFERVLTEGETSVYKQISVLDAKNVNQYQYGVPYVIDLDDNYNEIKRKTLKKKIDLKELEPVVIKNPNNKSFIGYLDSIEEHDVYRSGNNILKGATTLDKFLQEETVQSLFTNNEEKQAILNDFAHLGGEDVVVIPIYSSKTKQYDGGFQSILQAAINKNTKKGKIIAFSASYDIFGDGNEKQVIVFLIDDLKNREEKLHSDTILEELIHIRELKIFNKYFKTEKGKLTLKENVDKNSIPVEVNILNSLYEQAYKKFGKEIELKLKELENNGKSTSKEYNDYLKFQYAMSNVHEFIAHTMYSREFREALDSSMKDATFVERIINAVINMFKRFFKESEHKYSNYVIDATYRLISKGYSTNVNVYETYRNRIKDKLNETISDYEQLYDELNNELFIDNTRSLVPNINKDQAEEVKYPESNATDSIDEEVNNQGDVTFEVTMDSVFSLFNEIDGLENNVYEVFNAITEEEQLEAREFYGRYMEFIMNNHNIQNWDEIQKLLADMNKFKEFVDQKEVESENIEEKYKQADSDLQSNQSNVQYQKQIDLQAEQDSVLEEFANSLSERFNISFDLVSEEEARSMLPEYANEPAFFDPKTKKAYLVKGKANKTSAIHEIFTHPFLLQIEKTNPTLYKNLLKEAKNNKSVVDYVDNLYGTNQNNDYEYIARAIDLAVQGELDQQKDKTLLERIQDFFNQLYDYLKKLFNIPEVFSSAISPNITLQQLAQFAMYGKGKMNLNPAQENIEYSLKATDVIVKNLDKIKQWEKNKSISEDVLWKKIQELQVPKEQLELIKNSEGNTVEEKLLDFANQYSYTVEINTSVEDKIRYEDSYSQEGEFLGTYPIEEGKTDKPTQHYSNLTVPGGTNYTENAHVIPAMKGKVLPDIYPNHDQEFANGDLNMYGWDRSDDANIRFDNTAKSIISNVNDIPVNQFTYNNNTFYKRGEAWFEKLPEYVGDQEMTDTGIIKAYNSFLNISGKDFKTRRILEIQSKFQKWRLNFEHKGNKYQILENQPTNNPNVFEDHYLENGKRITGKEYSKIFKEFLDTPTSQEDAFIKLIAKQWETLMIKSIIQDSAKKGYEKVLFPKGDTAAKIEGHQTLEEFKKQKEARIKELESNIKDENYIKLDSGTEYKKTGTNWEVYINGQWKETSQSMVDTAIKDINRELTTLKQELADVESGQTQLSSIAKFYENTVANILINDVYGKESEFVNYEFTFNNDKYERLNDKNQYLKNGKEISQKEFNRVQNSVTKQDKKEGKFIDKYYINSNALITDEYGNTWNEVVIDENRDNQNIVFQKTSQSDSSTQYQLPQGREIEEFVASEKTIRDLAARMSYRIGIPVRFETDRTKKYKCDLEYGTAVINLAYATLDTPIHEILGHPIIRTIKGDNILRVGDTVNYSTILEKDKTSKIKSIIGDKYILEDGNSFEGYELNKVEGNLYQNLLKELEYGKGKEVFDRIKRDYNSKQPLIDYSDIREQTSGELKGKFVIYDDGGYLGKENTLESAKQYVDEINEKRKYTLEEQQEKAIVELLGLYTAGKIKEGKLFRLLRQLWKKMSAFMRDLLRQHEVEVDKLPDNMTLGDIADLLAYSNSKLILPGYEVVYTTPDNQEFKTYAETNNHISELAESVENVDLSDVDINTKSGMEIPNKFTVQTGEFELESETDYIKENNIWYRVDYDWDEGEVTSYKREVSFEDVKKAYYSSNTGGTGNYGPGRNEFQAFIEENKEYAQTREIIEKYKKVNNIQYIPEEAYSRGQEFIHVHNAYGDIDTRTWLQNLIPNLEDVNKANGVMEMSFLTYFQGKLPKHVTRRINEKAAIKIIAYPKSKDIAFASKIDNHTSSYSSEIGGLQYFIDLSKVSKREQLAVNYTKSVKLKNINTIEPNIADTIDDVAHHNEYAINIADGNFRIEYGEETPYDIKKLIDSINSILDERYGKLVKPEIKEINVRNKYVIYQPNIKGVEAIYFDTLEEANKDYQARKKYNSTIQPPKLVELKGIQPTQTNETLKESIEDVRNRVNDGTFGIKSLTARLKFEQNKIKILQANIDTGNRVEESKTEIEKVKAEINRLEELIKNPPQKEYTEQALTNIKVALLKKVAKNYPRSLITSKVRPIPGYENYESFKDELFLQKVSDSSIVGKIDINYTIPIFENPNEFSDEFMNHC